MGEVLPAATHSTLSAFGQEISRHLVSDNLADDSQELRSQKMKTQEPKSGLCTCMYVARKS